MFNSTVNRLQHVLNKNLATNKNDFVYVIKCQDFVKIGIAYDVKTRLHSLQTGCPFKLTLIASWRSPDATAEEEALHERFEAYRERGEWFKLPADELIGLLDEKAG